MKSLPITFTVKEWRLMAATIFLNSERVSTKNREVVLGIAHRIVDETGKYNADGEPFKQEKEDTK